MKNLFSMLSLLICFELILSPVIGAGESFIISSARAEDCPAGLQFDSTLNRCITSQQTAEVMNAVSNCNGDKECYKANAEQAMKDAEEEGKIKEALANKGGLMGTGMGIAAIAVPLVLVIGRLASPEAKKCSAISGYLMLGAGVAAFAGEKLANGGHKKRLKKIKEEWDNVLKTSTDSTKSTSSSSTATASPDKALASEAQSQAFEMLAKSEDSMAKAASMKATFYGVAAAAFAGVAVMAGLELMKPVKTPCTEVPAKPAPETFDSLQDASPIVAPGSAVKNINQPLEGQLYQNLELQEFKNVGLIANSIKQSNDLASFATIYSSRFNKYSSASLDDYESNKVAFSEFQLEQDLLEVIKSTSIKMYYNLIPISEASAQTEVIASTTGKAAASKGLSGIMTSPVTRLIAGGVLGVWSGMMALHAMKQSKISKNRAAFLRKMKDEFNDATTAIGSCSASDRTNPGKPTCYCYTDAGQRNSARATSDICTKLFNGKSLTGSGNYLAGTSSKTCITTSGAEDAACTCKSSNTCAKVSLGGVSGLDTGTFSLLNGAVTDLNNLTNGKTDAASVNAAGSVANAARLLDKADKNLQKSKAGQAVAKNKNKLAQNLAKQLTAAAAGLPPYSDSSSNLASMSPSQAVAELQNELKKAEPSINTASGGQTLASPTSNSPAEDALDFNLDGDNQGGTDMQVAEVMKQNLDYGQNDINKSTGENLFNVLSNRYQRSGMRRLFDEEGKTKSDSPNKDDITK